MHPSLLLLVDDEPAIADLVRRYGTRAGHRVECFPDVPSAWKYLTAGGTLGSGIEEQPFPSRRADLLLLDLNLPGISGLDLCRKIRATPDLATLPVSLFTMFDRPDDLVAGLEVGTDFLFLKDLIALPDAWLNRLEEILSKVHGQAQPLSLSSTLQAGLSEAPEQLIATINQALRLPLLRQLGPAFLRAVARRVCRRLPVVGEPGPGRTCPTMDLDFCLLPSGLGFDPDPFAHRWPAAAVVVFAVGLTEEITQVLGRTITAPFRATLAASLPAFSQVVANK
jgi:two-component system phosphate regulon response regulator PhoB